MDVRVRIGQNVRKLRLAAGVSQEELADRTGIDRTYVSGLERGVRNPTVVVLCDLAQVLGVAPAVFLDGLGPPARATPGAKADR